MDICKYLYNLCHYLLNAYQKDERVILIVDEAHGLNPDLLEEIRLLSNLETSKSKLIQIVLVGQPELDRTLAHPGFRQLSQRINMRYHLSPLTQKETEGYIAKRLRVAGAQEPIFTKKAIEEIYLKSGGKPRLINILCDNALLNGYALDQKVVDVKSVREVAKDLKLGKKYRRIWSWFILIISMAVGILLIIYLQQTGYLLSFFKRLLLGFQMIKEWVENGLKIFPNLNR